MIGPLFSASWHRVAGLRPALPAHAKVHRQEGRDGPCCVIEDCLRGRYYRLAGPARTVIALLDGRRTADEVWREAATRLGEGAPSQDDIIRLICQLRRADLLDCGAAPEGERSGPAAAASGSGRPLFWRIPLLDPDRTLDRLLGILGRIPARSLLAVWLAMSAAALFPALGRWDEIFDGADRIFAPANLLVLWGAFLGLKLLHELAHALALKSFGGAVHEMGIALLVITPVPYVDASAATALRGKRERILVGAAGMMAEVFIASLALFAWMALEPGPARALLRDIVIAAGISTILINLNPLVRFDGYYMLCDVLGVPNLYPRSIACLARIAQRFLLGNRALPPVPGGAGGRGLLALFGCCSLAYRYVVLGAILLFLADRAPLVGVPLGIWAIAAWVIGPLAKGARFLFRSPRRAPLRWSAVAGAGAFCLAAAIGAALVPIPSSTVAEGVILLSEDAIIRPGTDVFIRAIASEPGRRVSRGEALFIGEDPQLAVRAGVLEAEVEELRARRDESLRKDPVRAQIIGEELSRREKALSAERERLRELTVRSGSDGIFLVAKPEDLPGRFVARGSPIACVVSRRSATIRVAVPQDSISLVRSQTKGVTVRFPDGLSGSLSTSVIREVPAASSLLPSPALGSLGGGDIPADPRDAEGSRSLEGTFQLDLEMPDLGGDAPIPIGGRMLVRFEHDPEPLAAKALRRARSIIPATFRV
jgi:putative peptide zinc metalloprotease protein